MSEAYKLPKVPGAEETGLGARIGGERDQRKKYKYAESRIVRAMCAAPIVIVLSVVLYQRCEYCCLPLLGGIQEWRCGALDKKERTVQVW